MNIDKTQISVNRIITTGRVAIPNNKNKKNVSTLSFEQVFQGVLDKTQDIKFSKHAVRRMEERNINLSSLELNKMKEVIDKAKAKGIKDSLVLMNNTAFVVNIPSKTVITAVDSDAIKGNIFTNIDGAVVL